MKKLVAIVMSLAMIVTCMPMMAFAGVVDDHSEEVKEKLVEEAAPVNQEVLDLVQDKELIDAYLKASDFVDQYKEIVDGVVKALKEGDTAEFLEYAHMLDDYILGLYDYAADYAAEIEADPEVQKAIEELKAQVEELNDLLKEEYGIDLLDGLSDEEIEIIKDKIDEIKADIADIQAEIEKTIADLVEALENGLLEEALEELIEQAKEWAKEAGVTDEQIDEFMKQVEEIAAIVQEYAGMDPNEALDKLIEEAQALIEENADAIIDAAMDALNDAAEGFFNGDYDDAIKAAGLDPDLVRDVVNEIINYAMGAAAGDTYTALQEKVADLEDKLDAALAENAALADQLEQLKKDAEAQKASADEKDEIIKKFINGYNVTKKKPTMKKAKAAKKKKVKVTFKGLKGLEATKYQINYKVGKKAKNKTVKKATTSAKTIKYTLKKLKKGKKYTVKVRAIYQFKYNGKTYKFTGKWSKAKKVKVK